MSTRYPVTAHLPAEFRAAFIQALAKDGRTQAQVLRSLILDFCKGQGVDVSFDESEMREGYPAGRPRPDRRKSARQAVL